MSTNDELGQRIVPRYAPRTQALAIPAERWDEEPTLCPRINRLWVSHIIGVLEALDQPDAWLGTDDEIFDARQQVEEIIVSFMHECEGGCMDCCQPTIPVLHRVTEDGQLQISYDNGETWITDPNDPRLTGTSLPPPILDETHTKCDAASNGLQHIKDLQQAHSADMAVATTAVELMVAIAAEIVALLFAPEAAPIIIPIIFATVNALFELGQAAYDAYFTSDVWDSVLCCLYCNIGEDGQFNDGQYAGLLACIGSDLPPSVARDMLYRDLVAMGRIGLNNICSYGSSSDADCSACDCGLCDMGEWDTEPGFGNIIDVGDDFITFESEFSAGSHRVIASTHTGFTGAETHTEPCCIIESVEVLTGAPTSSVLAAIVCGNSYDNREIGLIGGKCIWGFELDYDAAVTVKVTFGAPCSPPP